MTKKRIEPSFALAGKKLAPLLLLFFSVLDGLVEFGGKLAPFPFFVEVVLVVSCRFKAGKGIF